MRNTPKKFYKANKYLLMLYVIVVSFSLITATFSWLFQNRERIHNLLTSNFILTTEVYFLQSDNSHVSAAGYRDAQTGYYIINISNPNAVNYATRLNINVKYKGLTKSYIRVYVGDMWLVNNKSIFKTNTLFTTSNGLWLDNRIYDNCYYYVGGASEERGMAYSATANAENTYQFISGFEDFAKINNGILYLEIRAEAVQINRIEAFWGINQLPT